MKKHKCAGMGSRTGGVGLREKVQSIGGAGIGGEQGRGARTEMLGQRSRDVGTELGCHLRCTLLRDTCTADYNS